MIQLPTINLSGLAVGATGVIDLTNVGVGAGGVSASPSNIKNKATIYIFNDSGTGLSLSFKQSGNSLPLPAGAWLPLAVDPGETFIQYSVIYLLPNPPVTLLLLWYFFPGEDPPANIILGNSPVGIGGSIPVTNNTLVNDGSTPGTQVIEMTPSDALTSTWVGKNDGTLTIKKDQSGTLSTLLQLINGANASVTVKLGNATDGTEVLGNFIVDSLAQLFGGLQVTGSIVASTNISANGGGSGFDGSNNAFFQNGNSQAKIFQFNGTTILLGTRNSTDTDIKAQTNAGSVHFQTQNAVGIGNFDSTGTLNLENGSSALGKLKFADGSTMAEMHGFTGTGSGTFSHNCTKTPNNVQLTTNVVGSQTMGFDTAGASTVHVTTGAGLGWNGMAFVFN